MPFPREGRKELLFHQERKRTNQNNYTAMQVMKGGLRLMALYIYIVTKTRALSEN